MHGIEGPITGIPLTAESGKKKILLLKGKEREIPDVGLLFYIFYNQVWKQANG